MRRPVHFEIHVEDPEVSIAFFSDVLGWRSDRWGDMPYWLQSTGEGPGIVESFRNYAQSGVVANRVLRHCDVRRLVCLGGAEEVGRVWNPRTCGQRLERPKRSRSLSMRASSLRPAMTISGSVAKSRFGSRSA